MDRISLIRSTFDTTGHGLEIGPSYRPILPKREGFNVEVIDHADTATLRAKYALTANIDPSAIEEVDHVWDGRSLPDVVGRAGCFDYVVASHVIEHVPDLLGFLLDCAALLAPAGTLVLAVPDKRRCFDVFRPLSSTGAVLQAHAERRRVHPPAVAFDHVASLATRAGNAAWNAGAAGDMALLHDVKFAKAVFDRSATSPDYFDFHAWTFTPSSFRLIVQDLNAVGALGLHEARWIPLVTEEFVVTLRLDGDRSSRTRLDLLQDVEQELRAG